MYKFSVSKLEAFRKFFDGVSWMSEEKLITQVTTRQPWSGQMEVGGAIHTLIEKGPEPFRDPTSTRLYVTNPELPGSVISLDEELIKPVLDYRAKYPNRLHEMPESYVGRCIQGFDFTLNFRIDCLWRDEVHEYKTKHEKDPDYLEYEESLQWKVYLLQTKAAIARYFVFKTVTERNNLTGLDEYRCLEPLVIDLYPYDQLETDIQQYAGLFIEWALDKKIEQHLGKY